MDFSENTVIYPSKGIKVLQIVLILSKLVKAVSYFAAYDLLQSIHSISFLLMLKVTAVLVMFPLVKPLSGSKLKSREWFHLIRHSVLRMIIDLIWIEGLFLCGPLRFILLFEHSELLVLAAFSTLIFGSNSTSKARGTVFFLIGIICVVFFDHDFVHSEGHHPEGTHKSLLIHHIYELFANFGFSDHKVGVLVLIVAVCLDAGFAAASRNLLASVGGARRLHALSAMISIMFLIPLFVFVQFFGTNMFSVQEQDLSAMDEQVNANPGSLDSVQPKGSATYCTLWLFFIGIISALDFNFNSLFSTRLGAHTVTNISKFWITCYAFVLRKHFPDELIQQKKNVRLIFQGRELIEFRPAEVPSPGGRPKAQRLRDYGVTNGSTIHCLITPIRSTSLNGQRSASRSEAQRPTRNMGFASSSNESILTEFDIGTRLMKPLFAFLLLFTWFFRVAYRQYFNSVSTFALVALTVFFCGAVFTVNAASTLASVLGIATADNDMRSLIENPADGNSDGDGSNHPNDLQVVTVTMVARRFPAQSPVQLPQNSTPSSSDSNTTQSAPGTNNQS